MEVTSIILCAFAVALIASALLLAGRYFATRHDETPADNAPHAWSYWIWSQDGWVRRCKFCQATQYGGDESLPDNGGPIENTI